MLVEELQLGLRVSLTSFFILLIFLSLTVLSLVYSSSDFIGKLMVVEILLLACSIGASIGFYKELKKEELLNQHFRSG